MARACWIGLIDGSGAALIEGSELNLTLLRLLPLGLRLVAAQVPL